jgi:hypothetical protein
MKRALQVTSVARQRSLLRVLRELGAISRLPRRVAQVADVWRIIRTPGDL